MEEIPETDKNISFESWIQSQWKIGSQVEIYSSVTNSWLIAKIKRTFNDSRGDGLEVEYAVNASCTTTAPILRNSNEIRPLSNAIEMYRYIYDAIQTVEYYNQIDYDGPLKSDHCNKLVFGYVRNSIYTQTDDSLQIMNLCFSYLYPLIPNDWTEMFDHKDKLYYTCQYNDIWYRFNVMKQTEIDADEKRIIKAEIAKKKFCLMNGLNAKTQDEIDKEKEEEEKELQAVIFDIHEDLKVKEPKMDSETPPPEMETIGNDVIFDTDYNPPWQTYNQMTYYDEDNCQFDD